MRKTASTKMRILSVILSLLMVISVISFPTLKPKAAAGTIDDFVERCYTVTLGRGSDPDGFADWKGQLTNGQAVGVHVAYGFLFSPEYTKKNKSPEDYVTDLYMLFMGREPDEAGFNDWVGQLKDGKSRVEVFAGFANSQEFYNICESYGITAGRFVVGYDRFQVNDVNLFVERLYKVCFNRIGDRGGQRDWVEKLIKKQITGSECARNFIQSKEYENLGLSDSDYVENLYIALMGRASDAPGKTDWLTKLANGMTRDEVFAGFVNSVEFDGICKKYNIERGTYTATKKGTYDPNNPNNVPVNPSDDNPDTPQTHTHKYNKKNTDSKYLKSAATCTKAAVYYYSCECGEKGTSTFTSGNPKGHKYNKMNTASEYLKSSATCTEAAVYYYSCECGDYNPEHVFTSGNPLGHDFDEGTVTKEASLTEYGTKVYKCKHTGCTETISESINSLLSQANEGDIIKYGKYEQDGDISNGKEDIEWRILSKEVGRVLVVSEYGLDQRKYNDVEEEVTWETSSLKTWLNGDFRDEAFTDEEKSAIQEARIINNNNSTFDTPGGNDTNDYLFCLSYEEAELYFGECNWHHPDYPMFAKEKLICTPTQHTINKGVSCETFTSEEYEINSYYNYSTDVIGTLGCYWWLRSPGHNDKKAIYVNPIGSADEYRSIGSCYINDENIAVRPAMYIEYTTHAEHNYSVENTANRYIKIPATCTEPAVYYYSCECGKHDPNHTFTAGDPLGHLWDEGIITREATVVEDGLRTYRCKHTGCTETRTEIIPSLSHTKVGDIITFGRYEQDGDNSNGKEPIEWRVLSKEAGRILVISEYGLEEKKYNDEGEEVTWETCSLRNWLNSDFLNESFTGAERICIPKVTLENNKNTLYDISGGNSTDDYVFCLSIDDINTYFGEHNWISSDGSEFWNENLICTPTQYALNSDIYNHTIPEETYESLYKPNYNYSSDVIGRLGCFWWIRTPGCNQVYACAVNYQGASGEGDRRSNNYVNNDKIVVRPAMYIDFTIHPEHEFNVENTDSRYLKSEATHFEPAVYYYSCACGECDLDHTFTYGSPAPHEFTVQNTDSRYLRSAATHTDPATYYYSCECGEMDITRAFVYGSPVPHEFTIQNTDDMYLKSEATHSSPAIYYYSCECGAYDPDQTFTYGSTIPHEFIVKNTDSRYLKSAATCTEAAVYYYSCECGECDPNHTFSSGRALGHRYTYQSTSDIYLKSPATCTEAAVYYYKCTRCEEHGATTYSYGDPLGHDYEDFTVTKEPTLTECGERTGYCNRCSATVIEKIPCLLSQANVGDTFMYGKYEQDGVDTNGAEDIEWRILSKEDGRMLVISEYILDMQKFDERAGGTTWENSQLRTWLNNDFLNGAFSASERSNIPLVTLENKNNSVYNTSGGSETDDYVFCLSVEEAEKYFGDYYWQHSEYSYGTNEKLIAYPTQKIMKDNQYYFDTLGLLITSGMYESMVSQDCYAGYSSDIIGHYVYFWWLRTPGKSDDYGCVAGPLGNLGEYYDNSTQFQKNNEAGIRPAMYIEYETE